VRPYLEKTLHNKWAGGVPQSKGPEFKPQYHKRKKKEEEGAKLCAEFATFYVRKGVWCTHEHMYTHVHIRISYVLTHMHMYIEFCLECISRQKLIFVIKTNSGRINQTLIKIIAIGRGKNWRV
jgi:hypothetical protein